MPVTTRSQAQAQQQQQQQQQQDLFRHEVIGEPEPNRKQKRRREDNPIEGESTEQTKPKTMRWYQNGALHRNHDLPAIVTKQGTQKWYRRGKLHRDAVDDDGNVLPAVICANGDAYWFQYGLLHRDAFAEKPAIIRHRSHLTADDGIEVEYYLRGIKQHRIKPDNTEDVCYPEVTLV